jgi:Tfp pilus assembly protein PilO
MNFKLILEEYLQRIDSFFKEKSKKDTYMFYIIIFGLAAALAYPFYDSSLNEFNAAKKRVKDIKVKINADNMYLKANPQAKIDRLDMDIKKLEAQLLVMKENNQYIKDKIETISSLIYDEVRWGEYLNSVSINAKKHNIKIINFTNSYTEHNESFGHVLDIGLKVAGNYSNTVRFISSLEKSELVVDLHDFHIQAGKDLNASLDISVWGITY